MTRPFPLLLAAAALLVGCGGGGSGEAEMEVERAIKDAAMTVYPTDCVRYATPNFLEQSTKKQGRAAVRACEESTLEEPVPDAVLVSDVEVDGDKASAQVAFEGGNSDGQAMLVALVKIGSQWKLHELLSFVVFDREQMIVAWGRQALERARTPEQVDAVLCVLDQFEKLSDADLEALILDPSPEPGAALIRPCEPRSAAI